MEAVGYELYAKLLGEAVSREKGEEVKHRVDTTVDIKLDAFLPDDYIPDVETRLSIYKRIAAIGSDDEEQEMLDELIDRFGDVKKSVMNLLFVSRLRRRASEAYITEIRQVDGKVSLKMDPMAPVNVSQIPDFVKKHSPYIEFVADSAAPAFVYNYSVNNRIKEKDVPDKLMELVGEFAEELLQLS
jgi:transcription-repair coupling factor (superfamily II helicase)